MLPRISGAHGACTKRKNSLLDILNWTCDTVGDIIAAQTEATQHIDNELSDFSRAMQQFRLDHRIPPEVSSEPSVLPPGVPPPGLPHNRQEFLERVGRSESPDEFDRYNDSLDEDSSWLEESTVTASDDGRDTVASDEAPVAAEVGNEGSAGTSFSFASRLVHPLPFLQRLGSNEAWKTTNLTLTASGGVVLGMFATSYNSRHHSPCQLREY